MLTSCMFCYNDFYSGEVQRNEAFHEAPTQCWIGPLFSFVILRYPLPSVLKICKAVAVADDPTAFYMNTETFYYKNKDVIYDSSNECLCILIYLVLASPARNSCSFFFGGGGGVADHIANILGTHSSVEALLSIRQAVYLCAP